MSCKTFMPVLALALFTLIGGSGCAQWGAAPRAYDYFATPAADDVWSWKIGQWQNRARSDAPAVLRETETVPTPPVAQFDPRSRAGEQAKPLVLLLPEEAPSELAAVEVDPSIVDVQPEPGRSDDGAMDSPILSPKPDLSPQPDMASTTDVAPSLREKYSDFRSDRRRALARDLSDWIQGQALIHYKADGPIDRWATLEETLRSNGDDCDGLELLVYDALLSLGFDRGEVFRAVVYRPEDLQHHMVTLWFEDPADPWVIDPTGAMTNDMRLMSELPGWVPLKVFGFQREFTVKPGARELARSEQSPVAVAQR